VEAKVRSRIFEEPLGLGLFAVIAAEAPRGDESFSFKAIASVTMIQLPGS
jgi:hypothetical protein